MQIIKVREEINIIKGKSLEKKNQKYKGDTKNLNDVNQFMASFVQKGRKNNQCYNVF